MIQNKLFRDCLAAIPAEQKAEFDLSFGIARIETALGSKLISIAHWLGYAYEYSDL